MSISEKLRRWQFRQRRAASRALWMHGPFTRREAMSVGRQVKFSPFQVARILRASRRVAHG